MSKSENVSNHVDKLIELLTRKPAPYGQITVYKALYDAGENGLSLTEMANQIRGGNIKSMRSVLAPISVSVNNTEGLKGQGLKAVFHKIEFGEETHYVMRDSMRLAIDYLPSLKNVLSLSLNEIKNMHHGNGKPRVRQLWVTNANKKSDKVKNVLDDQEYVELAQDIRSKGLSFEEGGKRIRQSTYYQRNKKAREECIKIYGVKCSICGFDFEKTYGEIGKGYIQVHHINELSSIEEVYEVNPETDLLPVCANCHVIIHRKRPSYTIKRIKDSLK